MPNVSVRECDQQFINVMVGAHVRVYHKKHLSSNVCSRHLFGISYVLCTSVSAGPRALDLRTSMALVCISLGTPIPQRPPTTLSAQATGSRAYFSTENSSTNLSLPACVYSTPTAGTPPFILRTPGADTRESLLALLIAAC
jgi:hypothetical protein